MTNVATSSTEPNAGLSTTSYVASPWMIPSADYAAAAIDHDFDTCPPSMEFERRFQGANQRPGKDNLVLVQVLDAEIVHSAFAPAAYVNIRMGLASRSTYPMIQISSMDRTWPCLHPHSAIWTLFPQVTHAELATSARARSVVYLNVRTWRNSRHWDGRWS